MYMMKSRGGGGGERILQHCGTARKMLPPGKEDTLIKDNEVIFFHLHMRGSVVFSRFTWTAFVSLAIMMSITFSVKGSAGG